MKVTSLGLCAVVLTASACVTRSYVEPVASFQKSVETSAGSIAALYQDMNELERGVYLDQLATSGEPLGTGTDSQPTPLLGKVFSPEGIKARLDALRLLGAYGQKLMTLASSKAPEQFAKNISVIGKNLESLASRFQVLKDGGDGGAASYIGPVQAVVGAIGSMVVERRRAKAIRTAVESADPSVTQILDLLQADLETIVVPARQLGETGTLARRVREYNKNRQGKTPEQRRKDLAEIRLLAQRQEVAELIAPKELIDSMRSAHQALLAYVRMPESPQNLAELASALETFNVQAEAIAELIRKIRGD